MAKENTHITGVTERLAKRLLCELNRDNFATPRKRRSLATKLSPDEYRAAIAALQYVLMAPGWTR
jgi:hypothetical protein